MSEIKDLGLAQSGRKKISWVESYMPVLSAIKERFERQQPFAGKKISMSIHLEAKTAYLAKVLRAGGAEVYVTGCNPLSTQDDVAAALAAEGFEVNAFRGVTPQEYERHLRKTLSLCPDVMIDDGGDFTHLLHGDCREYGKNLIGGCEETTTGVARLRAREREGKLNFPMININDADCKHLFDNRYGTGQSTMDAIMHTTNLNIAGKFVVVAGYGWCGKGISMRAKGMGANIIVTEVDPVKAIEAVMDGFNVMPMRDAAKIGDLFITVTGCKDVITKEHFPLMKDGAILCNSGHFDCEVNKWQLSDASEPVAIRRDNIEGFKLKSGGKMLNLLAEGRLVNLAAGNGHPAEIMDMSFALQSLCLEYFVKHGKVFENKLYPVPSEIDKNVASMKLAAMGFSIDSLTEEQEEYLASSEH